jgi:hypothetical protein
LPTYGERIDNDGESIDNDGQRIDNDGESIANDGESIANGRSRYCQRTVKVLPTYGQGIANVR